MAPHSPLLTRTYCGSKDTGSERKEIEANLGKERKVAWLMFRICAVS